MGNGLYYTTEFIKKNNGEFILHSGNYVKKIINGKEKVYHTSNWNGTYLFLKIITSNDVDYKSIMDGYDLQDSFDFLYEEN